MFAGAPGAGGKRTVPGPSPAIVEVREIVPPSPNGASDGETPPFTSRKSTFALPIRPYSRTSVLVYDLSFDGERGARGRRSSRRRRPGGGPARARATRLALNGAPTETRPRIRLEPSPIAGATFESDRDDSR